MLKHGDSVKFSDLPVGAEYTVSEQACGYYASYTISGTDRVTPLTDKNTVTDKQLTTSKITVQKDADSAGHLYPARKAGSLRIYESA